MIRIEPDWNVKIAFPALVTLRLMIRIEPDWNVKERYSLRPFIDSTY